MDIDHISILTGVIFSLIIVIFKISKLKWKFVELPNLMKLTGYIILAYTSALMLIGMGNLAILTWTNGLTLEIIRSNNSYIFLGWTLLGLSALIAYISLFSEEK